MDTIIRVYKYKLKLKKPHVKIMNGYLSTLRDLYNQGLQRHLDVENELREQGLKIREIVTLKSKKSGKEYEAERWNWKDSAAKEAAKELYKRLDKGLLKKELITQAKASDPNCPLFQVSTACAQMTLDRLDQSFQNFFRRLKTGEKPGYPRFKQDDEFNTWSYGKHGAGCKFNIKENGCAYLYLQHIGDIKVHFYRPLPENSRIRTLSVTKQANGWFVSLIMEIPFQPEVRAEHDQSEVYVSVGLEPIVETRNPDGSLEEKYEAPAYYRRAQEKLAQAQRVVSRRLYGSKNRAKAVLLLAKHHLHVANQRKEWHRVLAKKICTQYAHVFRPDVDIQPLIKAEPFHRKSDKTETNKAVLDNAWSIFFQCLDSAAYRFGCSIETYPLVPIEVRP